MATGVRRDSIVSMPISHAPRLAHVYACDAMHHGVLSCTPDTPLGEVARLMAEHDVSHLVVVGEASGRPEGILSTLDVAMVLAAG
jgi:CBS domain-containing protein